MDLRRERRETFFICTQGVDFSLQNFFWKSEGTEFERLFLFFLELLLMRKVKTPFQKVERVYIRDFFNA